MQSQSALAKLSVVVNNGDIEALVQQFNDYSVEHGFAWRQSSLGSAEDDAAPVNIELWRSDIKIFAANVFKPEKFDVGIYNNHCTTGQTGAQVEQIVDHLSAALGEHADITVTRD